MNRSRSLALISVAEDSGLCFSPSGLSQPFLQHSKNSQRSEKEAVLSAFPRGTATSSCQCILPSSCESLPSKEQRSTRSESDGIEGVHECASESQKLVWPVLLFGIFNIFTDTLLGSAVIPVLPRELHLDEMHQSIVLAVGAIPASFVGPLGGWLCDAWGWKNILKCFYPLTISSVAVFLVAHQSLPRYILARLLAGVASGFMYPSNLSMVSTLHPPHLRATAVGFTLAGDLGSLCGPTVGGILYDIGGAQLLYQVLMCICITNAVAFVWTQSKWRPSTAVSGDRLGVNKSWQRASLGANQVSVSSSRLLLSPQVELPHCYRAAKNDCSEACDTPLIEKKNTTLSAKATSSDAVSSIATAGPSPRTLFTQPIIASSAPCSKMSVQLLEDSLKLPLAVPTAAVSIRMHNTGTSNATDHSCYSLRCETIESNAEASSTREHFKGGMRELFYFCNIHFIARFISLFFCWGMTVTLQAILPYIWDHDRQLHPSTIGLLFIPHFISRVGCCAYATYFSDSSKTPLRSLIVIGGVLSTLSVALLSIFSSSSPWASAPSLILLGMAVGVSDSCITAWAGIWESPTSLVLDNAAAASIDVVTSTHRKGSYSGVEESIATCSTTHPAEMRGRSFALMALACDSGMFLVPLLGSFLTERFSFRAACLVLTLLSLIPLYLNLYCNKLEAKEEEEWKSYLSDVTTGDTDGAHFSTRL